LLIEPLAMSLQAIVLDEILIEDALPERAHLSLAPSKLECAASPKHRIIGVRPPMPDEQVFVCSRQGGERCWPHYRSKATELKKVLQERNIPSWQRERIPLVFYNNQLVAAVGVFYDRRFLSNHKDAIVFNLVEEFHPTKPAHYS
jgi:tRNA(Ile)-lysidine synthase